MSGRSRCSAAIAALVLGALAGCAAVPAPRTVHYQCEGGRGFSVTDAPAGGSSLIDISGMRFTLHAEPAAGPGRRDGCGVLTLWREGDSARVKIDAASAYEGCRRREP